MTGIDDLRDDEAIDLSFAGPPVSVAASMRTRVLEKISAYLPLVMMALIGGTTWWLVRSASLIEAPRAAPALKHEPDYTMTGFVIQRFAPDGAMRTQIEGDRLRHYPDDDTLEIDKARIRAVGSNGVLTLASADHAVSNGDGSEIQLHDNAQVLRPATATQPALEFRSEFLHAYRNIERVKSDLPVTITHGTAVFQASAMVYDNLARTLDFSGPAHAVFDATKPITTQAAP